MKKLIIHLNSSFYDEEIDNQFNIWKTGRVFADLGGILYSGLVCDDEWKAGKRLYYFVEKGKIEYIRGLGHARHFIELPIDWANQVYSVEQIPIYDENGQQTGTADKTIYIKDYYDCKENLDKTKVLVRLTDNNYEDFIFNSLIEHDEDGFPSNIRCHKNINEYPDYYQPETVE